MPNTHGGLVVLAFSNIENPKLRERAHNMAQYYAPVVADAVESAMPVKLHRSFADAIAYGDPGRVVDFVENKANVNARAFFKEHFIPNVAADASGTTWASAALSSIGYDTSYLRERFDRLVQEDYNANLTRIMEKSQKLLAAMPAKYRNLRDVVEFISDNINLLRQSDMRAFDTVFYFPKNRLVVSGNATNALDALQLAYLCKRDNIPVNTRHVSTRHSEQYVVIAGVDVVVPPALALFIDWLKTRP